MSSSHTKRADYLLFKKAFNIINRKEHLMIEGLQSIINIRASMNWGLSNKLKAAFPNVVPAVDYRQFLGKIQQIQDPHWLAGFASADGSFQVKIKANRTCSLGFSIYL